MEVLKTVQAFPAKDVTPHVLESALEAVSHIARVPRQPGLHPGINGLEPLVDVLEHCAKNKERPSSANPNGKASPRPDALRLAERACLALSNVVYKDSRTSRRRSRSAPSPSRSRCSSRPHPAAPSAARCRLRRSPLVNLADTSEATQDALDDDEPAGIILGLLTASASAPIVCAACLLLSHVAWSHANNQRRYGTEASIRQLWRSFARRPRRRPRRALSWGSERAAGAAAGARPTSNGGGGGDGGDGDEAPGSGAAHPVRDACSRESLAPTAGSASVGTRVRRPALAPSSARFAGVRDAPRRLLLPGQPREGRRRQRARARRRRRRRAARCVNDDDDDELAKTAY